MDTYIHQLNEADCAFASFKMLLATVSNNKNYLFLPQKLTKKTYSLWDIIKIAQKYDVKLIGCRLLDKKAFKSEIKVPFLADFKISENKTHLVLVKKIGLFTVTIYDPVLGIYKLSFKSFISKWNGIYLKITEHKELNYQSYDNDIFPNKIRIFGIFVQIFSAISIFLGFYFLDNESMFFMPLTFFALYFILEIISNTITKKQIKEIDSHIIQNNELSRSFIKKNYSLLMKYKTLFVTNPMVLINNVLICCGVVILLILNEINSLYCILILGIFLILDNLLYRKIIDKCKNRINVYERRIQSNISTDKQFDLDFNELSNASIRLYNLSMIRKYIVSFLIFLTCFTMMALTKNIKLNYLAFYFFLLTLFYEKMNDVLSYQTSFNEMKFLRAKMVSNLYKE